MIFPASDFVFKAPPILSRARRVLIKPNAGYPAPYPVSTSPGMLAAIINSVRAISDADIIVLESNPTGESIYPVYQALGYNFPRVLMLDVRDCIWVEVENPLSKPYAIPTFWVPNVVLSSDYLISVTPLKVVGDITYMSIMNLLSLLPPAKYPGNKSIGWADLYTLGIDKVIADLYFTLPFDFGIIEARQKFDASEDPTRGMVEECNLVFAGEPFQVDSEAVEELGLKADYLKLIVDAKKELEV
ncbi:MAG: DUF362 domain-containing protein [Chloroflexi bacterium]|nr:DUF362 domain-containing protein [Chloroflexota bacterium]